MQHNTSLGNTFLFRYMISLDLSYLTIPFEACNSLCYMINPILSGYCPLENLNLSRTKYENYELYAVVLYTSTSTRRLGYKGCQRVFEALAGNISLKELYICGNKFTDRAIPALVNFLRNADNSLVSLGISHNDITAQGSASLLHALSMLYCPIIV